MNNHYHLHNLTTLLSITLLPLSPAPRYASYSTCALLDCSGFRPACLSRARARVCVCVRARLCVSVIRPVLYLKVLPWAAVLWDSQPHRTALIEVTTETF